MSIEEQADAIRDMIESARKVKGEAFVRLVLAAVDVNQILFGLRTLLTQEQWDTISTFLFLKFSNLLHGMKESNDLDSKTIEEALAFADRIVEHSKVRIQ